MASIGSLTENKPAKSQLVLAGFFLTYRMVEDLVSQWIRSRRSANEPDSYAETILVYARNLGIWEKSLGSDHPQVALGLNNMAEAMRAQGKFAEAEPLYRRALEIYKRKLGPKDPKVAMVLWNHAYLLWEARRFTEAARMGAQAMAVKAGPAR
ncbi:MAG: tetratricopeptide repeat protein [Nitrospiraceae bacterium]